MVFTIALSSFSLVISITKPLSILSVSIGNCFKYISDINKLKLPQTRFNGIIIGHLHWPEIIHHNGFTYYNSGDWIDSLSWLEIDEAGQVRLKRANQLK